MADRDLRGCEDGGVCGRIGVDLNGGDGVAAAKTRVVARNCNEQ